MINEISVLIPCYNCRCKELVRSLSIQLNYEKRETGLRYEVLVADDGSTDNDIVEENKQINSIENCHYIIRKKNVGRAAIRNYLAKKAKYEWLLFIDGDIAIDNKTFIKKYLQHNENVIVGGIKISGNTYSLKNNIRYKYEKSSEKYHSAEQRQLKSHKEFRTTNFLIKKSIIKEIPFNETFIHYGYEDVLMGKNLNEHNICIKHIDNPVLLEDYEDNFTFIKKTEEALRTLHQFEKELQGYSTILDYIHKIKSHKLMSLLLIANKLLGKSIRYNLSSNKPHLFLFNIYKLLYYASLK